MYTILLVDDSDELRQVLKKLILMNFNDVEVFEANDGEEAYLAIGTRLPDLIFMDIGLPCINGLELTKQIKEKFSDLPIAIFSNYDYPEYRKEAFESGVNFYLSKAESSEKDIVRLIRNNKTP